MSAAVYAARWKVRVASSGSTVRSWPSIPPTRALTATSSANWAALARSPRISGRPCATGRGGGTDAVMRRSPAAAPCASAQSSGPPTRTAMPARPARSSRLAAVIARSPCPHITAVPVRRATWALPAGEVAELDVAGARARVRRRTRAVCRTSSSSEPSTSAGSDQSGARCRQPGRGPGVDAAGEFADDVVVADLRRLPDDLVGVLVGVADHDKRAVVRGDPAEPGRERVPQRDRHGPGDVAGGERLDRPHVDHDAPAPGRAAQGLIGRDRRQERPGAERAPGPRRLISARRRK